jgi:hypothetical protein
MRVALMDQMSKMKLIYIQSTDNRELIIPAKEVAVGRNYEQRKYIAQLYINKFYQKSYNTEPIPVVKDLWVFDFDYGTIITLGLTLSTSV